MRHPLIIVALVAVSSSLSQQSAAQDNARFPALRLEQLTPEQKKWAEDITAPPRNAKFSNPPYNEYIRSPELALRLTALSDYLRWNTSLSPRLSEFAILIAARQWTQQYEWHQHYPLAIKGGLDPKILADLIVGKRPGEMQDDETILYDFVTQIYRDKKISNATYDAAVAKFGERGVMDLIGIVGFYDLVSMTLIAAEAGPPKDDVPVLQPFPK
jgi:4-carboxymuconolactone decarboxylase